MRKREILKKRDHSIFQEFERLFNKGYRIDVINTRLSEKFFLAPETIQKIVLKQARNRGEGKVLAIAE